MFKVHTHGHQLYPILLTIRTMLRVFPKFPLKKNSHGIMRTLLRIVHPILNLLFYIILLITVLIWTAIQYPIKIASILGIWTTNSLILPTEAELVDRHRRKREGYESLCLR